MALEAIKQVTQAEQEVQRYKEEAAAAARQVVADAERDGRQLLEDSRRQAQAEAKQQLARAEEEAAGHTRAVLEQAGQDCDRLRQAARQRLDRAAELIMERVVKN